MAGIQGLADFANANAQKPGDGDWQVEHDRTLEVSLAGTVKAKLGSMVAYYGDLHFDHAGSGGLGRWAKKAFTGEGLPLMDVKGRGVLYLADMAKEVSILSLANEGLYVNGRDCLAFEDSLEWDIEMVRGAGMVSGGLFTVALTGSGRVAITSHGRPLVLGVSPETPLYTDPNATVAWSAGLETGLKTDVSVKTLIGRASGESYQMSFRGTGFVVVQPAETA